jgi:hypothetical protein
MPALRSLSCALRGACLLLLTASAIGCNLSTTATPSTPIPISGNWQFSSSNPAAYLLPSISGTLTGTSANMTGILHSDSANSCIAPTQTFTVKGVTGDHNQILMTNDNLLGGILSITGTLAPDGKSISNASYTIVGGTCEFDSAANADTSTSFEPISGNYAGTFYDTYGYPVISITATLTQTPASDTSGNYQLSGTGTIPNNPCFAGNPTISNSQVTGGNFMFTYTDSGGSGNSVAVTGTFSPDGTTLTVTNWALNGPCGQDQGTGTLTKQ